MSKLKIALIQLHVGEDKKKNVTNSMNLIKSASKSGAKLIILPECFNSDYGALQTEKGIQKYAENFDDSETLKYAKEIAMKEKVTLICGSIPIKRNNKVYNTSITYNPEGEIIGKHEKIHLFDINIPDQIVFEESKLLSPGNSLTTFKIPESDFKIGLGICFDVRFSELSQIYQRMNCNLLVFPAAFNMTTGPAHWNLLARARAMDNQCYVALCSPARNKKSSYVAYGHSMVVSPWGEVVSNLQEKEGILISEIDSKEVVRVRQQLPVCKNKSEHYDVIYKTKKS